MKIETKFDVGDEVCFLSECTVMKSTVDSIYANTDENGTGINYIVTTGHEICEEILFKSIKELTKHWEDRLK